MLEELEKKEKRLLELEALLSDPNVVNKSELFRKYAKEHSHLLRIVDKFRDYKKLDQEIIDIKKELLAHSDDELRKLAQSEIGELEEKKRKIIKTLEDLLYVEDAESERNIIVEIRAGTGGIEAALFAAGLYRMYLKYAARMNWRTEIISASLSEKNGFKEVIFSVIGQGAYKFFKYESGTHRVQRVPETETSGRIHTSAVTVAVLPEAEDVDVEIKPEDLKIDVFRAGGRGGQHVNVTDSAVRITHIPSGLIVSCQDERSQHKNKAKAMRVLKARLYDKLKRDQLAKTAEDRKKQVGSGDRSEKIRTYNFQDRRVTDHRINLTLYRLPEILEGDLDELIANLRESERKLRLGKKDKSN
ncbi:MAG: peptide chain release factor 1 [Candidatus Omnitrophica bacterium]|nr:peptide chain release factor 1 [Candidatus Omnitrophota bacterium]